MSIPPTLFCQAPELQDAYIPAERVEGAKPSDDPDKALLLAIYQTINYPRIARENGVDGLFYVDYTVLRNGTVKVDAINVIPDPASLDSTVLEDAINVIAYNSAGPSYRIRVPKEGTKRYDRYLKKLGEGQKALGGELVRVFTNLPLHEPARAGNVTMNKQYRKFVVFKLE